MRTNNLCKDCNEEPRTDGSYCKGCKNIRQRMYRTRRKQIEHNALRLLEMHEEGRVSVETYDVVSSLIIFIAALDAFADEGSVPAQEMSEQMNALQTEVLGAYLGSYSIPGAT